MPDTSVKYFSSDMTGAPALSGTAGTLISILDACLVNGFGSVTLDSIVVASNVATATVSTGHGLKMVGEVGPVVRIAGATPAGLNGDWRVASVPGSTTFTFVTSGISDQTATGTITAKRAPAGFEKAFSGTNKAAYRSLDVQSTQMYLRVDDSLNYSAAGLGYETMSDIDTGAGPFPSSSNYAIGRAYLTSSTARPWVLIADSQAFYLHVDHVPNALYFTMAMFGDILSFAGVDGYRCLFARSGDGAGGTQPSQGGQNSGLFSQNIAKMCLPRSYTQVGSAVTAFLYSTYVTTWGTSSILYPDAVGNGYLLAPLLVFESASILRGQLPGLYAPLNNLTPAAHKTVIPSSMGNLGRCMIFLAGMSANGGVAFDITGPWR